jgi:hypothetical protein
MEGIHLTNVRFRLLNKVCLLGFPVHKSHVRTLTEGGWSWDLVFYYVPSRVGVGLRSRLTAYGLGKYVHDCMLSMFTWKIINTQNILKLSKYLCVIANNGSWNMLVLCCCFFIANVWKISGNAVNKYEFWLSKKTLRLFLSGSNLKFSFNYSALHRDLSLFTLHKYFLHLL